MKYAYCAILFLFFSAYIKGANNKIVIGVPNWPSATAKAHILKNIIENNLGFKVELQTGTNTVIFEAMHQGSMHIHPETWSPNMDNLIKKYVNQHQTVKGASAKKNSL